MRICEPRMGQDTVYAGHAELFGYDARLRRLKLGTGSGYCLLAPELRKWIPWFENRSLVAE
jgi:hypothetical protein